MNDVPLWLTLPLGVLLFACYFGGIVSVVRATRRHGRWSKWLWRLAAFGFPFSGFAVFLIWDRRRRRNTGEAHVPDRIWSVALVLLIALGTTAYVMARNAAIVHVDVRHEPENGQYWQEWWAKKNGNRPPALCVAMSGGGIRSAAFNIGVLGALNEHGLLARTEIISAVSGGSYVLSWYLLQQYYVRHIDPSGPPISSKDLPSALFKRNGIYQRHLEAHARQFQAIGTIEYYFEAAYTVIYDISVFNVLRLVSVLGNENLRNATSQARREYRESLQRTFQLVTGSSPWEVYNKFRTPGDGGMLARLYRLSQRAAMSTDLSIAREVSFHDLAVVAEKDNLPFPIFVTTVDVDAEDQPGTDKNPPKRLWPSIFEINGWGIGSDSYGYKSWTKIKQNKDTDRFAVIRLVNVAPAISGAALSPTAGGLSVPTRRLMSLGNVDLGYRVPRFKEGELGSLYLSDGGIAENLGLYPLVRRNCQNIIVIDAEHEAERPYKFSAYRKVKKALPNDLKRALQVDKIDKGTFDLALPTAKGKISVTPRSRTARPDTHVYYVKLAMDKTKKERYGDLISKSALGRDFPHDPTSNQNFDELRFKAYRELGYLIAHESTELKELKKALLGADGNT